MKFALAFANTGPFADAAGATLMAKAAEDAGFESIWTVEHVVVPSGYESTYPYDASGKMPGGEESAIPDPLIWLAFCAAVTTEIRLATGILILPQRNPVVLAKEVATLDAMSGGRVDLGIGVGWLKEEFEAIGVDFHKRGKLTDDYVHAMRALWAGGKATYHSEFTNFDDCISLPTPAQGANVPIHVGGHTDFAAKRAGRLGDGFFPGKGSHEELKRLIEVTRQAAEDAGRDPAAIQITAGGNGVFGGNAVNEAEALAELGVDRVIVPTFLFWGNPADDFAAYGENVIAKVNG